MGAAICGALSGCNVVAQPEASPPSNPSATPAPGAETAALTFSGTSIDAVDDAGAVVGTTAFSSGAEQIVAVLTEELRAAPEITEDPGSCAAPHTLYRWDGVNVVDWADSAGFQIGVDVSSIGGVRLQAPGGYAVGDEVSGFVSASPAEDVGNYAEGAQFVSFDTVDRVVQESYNSPLGSIGSVEGGLLTSIQTPAQWSSFLC